MDLRELMAQHRHLNPALASRREEEVTLWYADLGVEVQDDTVSYQCPRCGRPLAVLVDEFVHLDSSSELRCDECRGFPEERGGPG